MPLKSDQSTLISGLSRDTSTNPNLLAIDSRMELDSHANMVLLGGDCFVFDGVQGRTCNVASFDPDLGTAKYTDNRWCSRI